MPGPVRAFAEHQPVTPIVDTIRGLLDQLPVGNGIWTALAWYLGNLLVAHVIATAAYHRRIAWRPAPLWKDHGYRHRVLPSLRSPGNARLCAARRQGLCTQRSSMNVPRRCRPGRANSRADR